MNEVLLLSSSSHEYTTLEAGRALLGRLGITYVDKTLPEAPTLTQLQAFSRELAAYPVCVWAAGQSAYLLPTLAMSVPGTLFIILPCPNEHCPSAYLETIFREAASRAPIAFSQPGSSESAVLLAVHWLGARHSSYHDILQAYLQQKHRLQTA